MKKASASVVLTATGMAVLALTVASADEGAPWAKRYAELSEIFNETHLKWRNLERRFTTFRNQLATQSDMPSFAEGVALENLMALFSGGYRDGRIARHDDLFFDAGSRFRQAGSLEEVYADAAAIWEENSDLLQDQWGVSPRLAEAFTYMNYVSALWAVGDPQDFTRVGCALQNRDTGFEHIRPEDVSLKSYQSAEIGCCTDFAYFLKFLLTRAGFENRIVFIPGHVTNEVNVDGKWWMMDAMAGVAIDRKTIMGAMLYNRPPTDQIATWLFPIAGMQPGDHRFRDFAGAFRFKYMIDTLGGTVPPDMTFQGDPAFMFIPYGAFFLEALDRAASQDAPL